MIGSNRIGDQLQDDGFTGSGWRDDQPSLAFPDRCDQIDDPGLIDVALCFHLQSVIGIQRG